VSEFAVATLAAQWATCQGNYSRHGSEPRLLIEYFPQAKFRQNEYDDRRRNYETAKYRFKQTETDWMSKAGENWARILEEIHRMHGGKINVYYFKWL